MAVEGAVGCNSELRTSFYTSFEFRIRMAGQCFFWRPSQQLSAALSSSVRNGTSEVWIVSHDVSSGPLEADRAPGSSLLLFAVPHLLLLQLRRARCFGLPRHVPFLFLQCLAIIRTSEPVLESVSFVSQVGCASDVVLCKLMLR